MALISFFSFNSVHKFILSAFFNLSIVFLSICEDDNYFVTNVVLRIISQPIKICKNSVHTRNCFFMVKMLVNGYAKPGDAKVLRGTVTVGSCGCWIVVHEASGQENG